MKERPGNITALFFYASALMWLKDLTENKPLSVNLSSGITGSAKNESVKNGLKSMLQPIVISA